MPTIHNSGSGYVGQSIRRKEDARLVRGKGKFVDDIKMLGMLHLVFVRSPYAHANITSVDVSEAEALPGVVCTLTGQEISKLVDPFFEIGPSPSNKILDYPMAVDRARYQGEPVAAVIAETPAIAEDAAELVRVEYEPLDVVIDGEVAATDKTILHPTMATNVVWNGVFEYGEVEKAFAEAAHIIHIDHLHMHRFSSTPLENNAVIAQWDDNDQRLYFWSNNSFPTIGIQLLAPALHLRMDQVRVQTHDIGGSFGIKITNYPQMAVCALASRKAGAPIKWTETRSEHMTSSAHGNERTFRDTRVALDKDGVILAVDSKHIDDCGAYPRYEPLGCVIWSQVTPATYRLKNLRIDFTQVVTNKCPVGPNRGYSRMQHLWFMERVIDICAHELNIPADEMRLRNYIRPDEFPYTTPNGCIYDSGNYPGMLKLAKELIGWDKWQAERTKAQAEGRWFGIGIGTTLDSGTNNFGQSQIVNPQAPFSGNSQAANAKLDIYGEVIVAVGSVPQGQGHETTVSQVVADILNISPELVNVRVGFDTERNVHTGHSGTYASQFAVSGLSAVHGAVQLLKAEMKKLAAFALQAERRRFGVRRRQARAGDTSARQREGDSLHRPRQSCQREHCGRSRWTALHHAELPLHLARAVPRARRRAKIWQPDADVLLAVAHCGGRDRQGDLHPQDSRLRRGGRLRHGDQSHDRRRPGAWRHGARHRRGADGKLRLRRERQHAGLDLQRLHADHCGQHAEHQVWPPGDAVAAQLQRRERHGRRRWRPAALPQRGIAGCAVSGRHHHRRLVQQRQHAVRIDCRRNGAAS